MLNSIFSGHEINDKFASYEFNFLLMAYSAYFIQHSSQQKQLVQSFSEWFNRVRAYREKRSSGSQNMWHRELPDRFIAKHLNNENLQFQVSTVKGLLLMVSKIFDSHSSQNKQRVETLYALQLDPVFSQNLEIIDSEFLDPDNINFMHIDTLVINSECGTGKSTLLQKIFQHLHYEIVSIVPRKTLRAKQIQDFQGLRDSHKIQIECFESAGKIQIPQKPFILLLDEMVSTWVQKDCALSFFNRANYDNFAALIQSNTCLFYNIKTCF